MVPSKTLGRVNIVKAHSSTSGPYDPAQRKDVGEGHLDFFRQGVVGPTGAVSNETFKSGRVACADLLFSVRNEGEVAPPIINFDGTICSGSVPKKVGCANKLFRSSGQTTVDDGMERGVFPLCCNVDGTRGLSRSNSPPRRHKKKGLMELGDSCPQLRRSARLSAKHSKGGSLSPSRVGSSSFSISDTTIRNCNYRLSDPVDEEEPDRLWVAGKKAGLICRGEEKEVTVEFGRMKVCDSEVLVRSKLGGKKFSLW